MAILFSPKRNGSPRFDELSKLDAAEAPELALDADRIAEGRAGLSEHKGLTNGSGRSAADPSEEPLEAAAPTSRRKTSIFGRGSRAGAREGPGFQRAGGLTNGAGHTNGVGLVNGRGRVNGGRVNGGATNGGRVNGGRVNGGRVNGGRVNGGRTNGVGVLYAQSLHQRRRTMTRRMAGLLAVLLFVVLLFGPLLYTGLFTAPPIVVDGAFADWGPVPMVPDAADDQPLNGDINLVGFAGISGERDLYFYIQVAQGFHPFSGPGGAGAESFLLLIDSDRSSATGYVAWGLGVDFLVELSGYGGALRTSALKSFPQGLSDRTDPAFFATSGAVRAIAAGNQIEGSVPLVSIGGSPSKGLPYLVFIAQDSLGREDRGDVVFSSRAGVLAMRQTPSLFGTLPTDLDVLLLSVEARAYHQNITLEALTIAVDGEGGAGATLSYAVVGGRNITFGVSAAVGGSLMANFSASAPVRFNSFDGEQRIDFWGRATGPSQVSTLRFFVAGSEEVVTGPPPPGASGHGSMFPPAVFEGAYVGAAPVGIRVDGAFADWGPTRPFDPDPDDDVSSPLSTPSPGAPNPPASVNQNIDIREARADVNTGALQVSFYVEVDGSIMAGELLGLPRAPAVAQPAASGGSAPGPAEVEVDIASVYIDTDGNSLTGWQALPGIGVDAVLQVWGKGGGYGRTPQATQTSQWAWDAAGQTFNRTARPLAVGFGSSKMETQLAAADLCGGPCGRIRYAFFMQDTTAGADATDSHDSNFRGDGRALYFSEESPRTRTAYPGDLHVAILAFTLFSGPANGAVANITALVARIEGIAPAELTAVALFRDADARGRLEGNDLAAGAVAIGRMLASGYVQLEMTAPISIAPGDSFTGLLAADIAWNATTPAWINATIAGVEGVKAQGVVDVLYNSPSLPPSVRLLEYQPGMRGQNQLVVNEVNFDSGWIEIYDTAVASTNLTGPARMGLEIYRTNPAGGALRSEAIIVFSGFTNSEGFAAFNYSVPYSTAIRTYFVAIWCNNCSAGQDAAGKNNKTYVDVAKLPQNTSNGAWGRYPDGNVSLRNTTNDTRNDNNAIPGTDNGTDPGGQNNLVVNEVNFVDGWIEIYASTGSQTDLTSPARMGVEIYRTNANGGNFLSEAIIVFTGTTNAEGFAVFNYSVPYSTATRRYHVAIWCSNCTAGQDDRGRNNQTYLDNAELPTNTTVGVWGRYPDGNGSFRNTTNNTRADNNQIPEFSDVVLPLAGVAFVAAARSWRRRAEGAGRAAPVSRST